MLFGVGCAKISSKGLKMLAIFGLAKCTNLLLDFRLEVWMPKRDHLCLLNNIIT